MSTDTVTSNNEKKRRDWTIRYYATPKNNRSSLPPPPGELFNFYRDRPIDLEDEIARRRASQIRMTHKIAVEYQLDLGDEVNVRDLEVGNEYYVWMVSKPSNLRKIKIERIDKNDQGDPVLVILNYSGIEIPIDLDKDSIGGINEEDYKRLIRASFRFYNIKTFYPRSVTSLFDNKYKQMRSNPNISNVGRRRLHGQEAEQIINASLPGAANSGGRRNTRRNARRRKSRKSQKKTRKN